MQTVVEIARDKIAALEAEISQHKKFLRLAEVLGYDVGITAPIEPSARTVKKYRAAPVAKFYTDAVISAIRSHLISNGPLPISDLFPIATKHGFAPPTNNPKSNLGARLSGGKDFVNFPNFGYWPADLDCPGCNYIAPKQ